MKRILLFSIVILSMRMVTAEIPASADTKTYKLFMVDAQKGEPYKTFRESLYFALAKLGYREGVNFEKEHDSLGHFKGRAQRFWKYIQKNAYDVIVLSGTVTNVAFKKIADKNPDVEFIFGCITDPVGVGLIDDFSNLPKRNFTGVAYPVKVHERFRFIKKVMPNVRKIGLIYADMPQSKSYNKWVREMLKENEFKDITVYFRSVEFVRSEGGHIRMTMLAKKHVLELDSKVDLFLAPNDQMGVQAPFSQMVYETATKPLMGIGKKEVMERWGAMMTITPSLTNQAEQVAEMVKLVFEGRSVKTIIPQWPRKYEIAFDLGKAKEFGVKISNSLLKKAGKNIVY